MENSFETVEEPRRQENDPGIFLLNISSLSHNLQEFSNVKISKSIFEEWQNKKKSSQQMNNNKIQEILGNRLFQDSDIKVDKQFFLNSNQKNVKGQANRIKIKKIENKIENKIEYQIKKQNKRSMLRKNKQSIQSLHTKATHDLLDLNQENQNIIDDKLHRGFNVQLKERQNDYDARYPQRTRYQRLLQFQGEMCLKERDNYVLLLRSCDVNGRAIYKQ